MTFDSYEDKLRYYWPDDVAKVRKAALLSCVAGLRVETDDDALVLRLTDGSKTASFGAGEFDLADVEIMNWPGSVYKPEECQDWERHEAENLLSEGDGNRERGE